VLGNLARNNIGSKGYVIYNWRGQTSDRNGIDAVNLSPGFSVERAGDWAHVENSVINTFVIDGQQGEDSALSASPTGIVNIRVPPNDTTVRHLTVFSTTNRDNAAHKNTITLTPAGASTPKAQYTVDEPENGLQNHIFQFQFTGDVTLTFERTGPSPRDAQLQAILLD
ncbi:MAG: hypothetical protein ABR589_10950, partial [Chthoniobacterales bacterium]